MLLSHHHFASNALYRERPESLKGFLSKRWAFWLALFSCIAFLVGNMVGQHGWRAFWKSVWGKEDVAIVFTGTVPPLPLVPDPELWSPMQNHTKTYADVPRSSLIPLPVYVSLRGCEAGTHDRRLLSVDYLGDYDSGGERCGSHPAADILTPQGTPVVAAMNGVVERVEERSWGFGNTVVLKHPNVPDPDHPERYVTLYSGYAHLGEIAVIVGEIVRKGDQIAVSGQTGLASAPHLHFQIDREAPFHPYWPYTTQEASNAGFDFNGAVNAGLGQVLAKRYTVNPLAYVAAFRNGVDGTFLVVAVNRPTSDSSSSSSSSSLSASPPLSVKERVLHSIRSSFALRRDARTATRIARRSNTPSTMAIALRTSSSSSSSSSASSTVAVISEERLEISLSTAEQGVPMPPASGEVAEITMLHDGEFHRGWEEIVLFARDSEGRFVRDVRFTGSLYIETAFGAADFSPSTITASAFDASGKAIIRMFPHIDGRRSIVPLVRGAFIARGEPLLFNPAEVAHTASETVSLQGGE